MIDFAELVVLNKFDSRGAEDALRDVRKQWKRNRVAFKLNDEDVPVYPTIASQFNDPGITWMFTNLCRLLREKGNRGQSALFASPAAAVDTSGKVHSDPGFLSPHCDFAPHLDTSLKEPRATVLIPGARVRYLAEIAEQGRSINAAIDAQAETADCAQSYWQSLRDLEDPGLPAALDLYAADALVASGDEVDRSLLTLRQRYNDAIQSLSSDALRLLREWPARLKSITDEVTEYEVRGKAIKVDNYRESL